MNSDMQKLAQLATIATTLGHRVVTSVDYMSGNCGPNVTFGLNGEEAFITVFGNKMNADEVNTLIADLLNGLFQRATVEWRLKNKYNEDGDELFNIPGNMSRKK